MTHRQPDFTEIPRVVGGPYEFGVPGARHAIMAGEVAEPAAAPTPALSQRPTTWQSHSMPGSRGMAIAAG